MKMLIFACKQFVKLNIYFKTMANNTELISQCEAKAKQWLTPAFDEETRKEVEAKLAAEDSWNRNAYGSVGKGDKKETS